jgi:hypothetical protein
VPPEIVGQKGMLDAGTESSNALEGIKVIFGTSKKTEPIDGPAYRIRGVKGTVIDLVEPIHHIRVSSVTVKRLKIIKECDYAYVQHVEVCKLLSDAIGFSTYFLCDVFLSGHPPANLQKSPHSTQESKKGNGSYR